MQEAAKRKGGEETSGGEEEMEMCAGKKLIKKRGEEKGLYANRGGDGNSILAFGGSGGASNKNQLTHDF